MCRRASTHINTRSQRHLETSPTPKDTHLLPHKHSNHSNSAGGDCHCGMTVDLVCSMVCDRDCLSHFTVCLQCLSESGARSDGVTTLICHADRLDNGKKSFQHRSYLEQLLESAVQWISLLLHLYSYATYCWVLTADLLLWKEQSHENENKRIMFDTWDSFIDMLYFSCSERFKGWKNWDTKMESNPFNLYLVIWFNIQCIQKVFRPFKFQFW